MLQPQIFYFFEHHLLLATPTILCILNCACNPFVVVFFMLYLVSLLVVKKLRVQKGKSRWKHSVL